MFLVVTILSVMLWTQCFNAIVRPQKDFDLQRFSGPWYRVGLAYDSPEFVPLKKYLQVSKGNITSDTDGNANLTVRGTGKKGCMCGVYHYKKTDLPGQFTYFSDRHQIWKDVTVVESNYTEYSLVVKYKEIMKNFSQVSLYGKVSLQSSLLCGSLYFYSTSGHYIQRLWKAFTPLHFLYILVCFGLHV
uniref:Lipocalin/cytosolic fatty-acid binding domain-containing protein n=1 Tax=Esox lucius TaxID=8010 RepID=A0AAY5K911_ESOLU